MVQYDTRKWLSIVFRLHGSVLPKLLGRVFAVLLVGLAALELHRRINFKIAPVAHTMVGVALGLLLVFRTNASFDRWWEGRKLIGAMVNRARDLSRQTAHMIDGDDGDERAALRRMIAGFFALTRQHLRGERDLGAVEGVLGLELRSALEPAQHRPAVMLSWISARLCALARAGRLTEQRLAVMDANLTALHDNLGGCERILRTPVPFAYAQHIKTFLMVFTFTAPFAMVDALHGYTPVAAAVLAFALYGIDEIGVEIEDPFGHDANDLPLDAIGEGVEAVTRETVERRPP